MFGKFKKSLAKVDISVDPVEAVEAVALPLPQRKLVCQILSGKTGVRSEPFSGTLNELQEVFAQAVQDDPKVQDHYVLCLMDLLYENQEDMDFSSMPVMKVTTFITLGAH